MKSTVGKFSIVVVLLLALAGVVYLKQSQKAATQPANMATQATATVAPPSQPVPAESPADTPTVTPPKASSNTPPTTATKTTKAPFASTSKPKPSAATTKTPQASTPPKKPAVLPRLLELGSDSCRPCQMMQPILASLRQEYAGKLQIDFIDVWKDTTAGDKYGIQMIPTQIFFDAEGKEVFRHVGYYPKDDILAKFREMGIAL